MMTLCVKQREIIYAQRYDVITAERDLAPEIHAMIRRTIGRIVDGHARSKQDEKLEAILTLPSTICFQKIQFHFQI